MSTPILFAAESAEAAPPLDEHQVLVFLIQLALLVGVARVLGGVMKMINQPPVVGELIAGVLLGPSVFGTIAPNWFDFVFVEEPVVNSAVFGIAWLGVITLLVVIGFETDLAIINRFRKAALSVSAGSLLIPLAVGATIALLAPPDFRGEAGSEAVFAAIFALALAVSALPVVAKILQDLGLLRRNFGQITLAAGMTMDSIGWLLLAALAGIARESRFDVAALGRSVGGLVLFLVIIVTVGRWLIDQLYRRSMARSGSSVTAGLTITLMAAFIGAAVTQYLELEAILGAFIVGILLSTTRHQVPAVRETLETTTTAFFAPVFFAFSGLRVDLTALRSTEALLWTAGVIVAALAAKVVGTYFGARLGGLGHREGLALGSGLSALGAMGIVVALVGLNTGVLSETGYTVLVLAAIVTSIVSPALLRLVVRGWEAPAEERQRLERESLRDSSVILGTRRILLPTRGGLNSQFAAQLVERVFDDIEVTVMTVDVAGRWRFLPHWMGRRRGSSAGADGVIGVLEEAATRQLSKTARDPVDAIAAETGLGYDMLVVGASGTKSETGMFSSVTDRILGQVSIPAVVVRFPDDDTIPEQLPRRVLVPVTGGVATRAAEEFAYSLAGEEGAVLALHVINRPEGQGMMIEESRLADAQRAGAELLADAATLGSRLGVRVDTRLVVEANPEEQIVEMANSGSFDVLVLGVASRALSNRPFFGHRVSYIVENANLPIVIVSIPDWTGLI